MNVYESLLGWRLLLTTEVTKFHLLSFSKRITNVKNNSRIECRKCSDVFTFTLGKERLFHCKFCNNEFILKHSYLLYFYFFLSIIFLSLLLNIALYTIYRNMNLGYFYQEALFFGGCYVSYLVSVKLFSKIGK